MINKFLKNKRRDEGFTLIELMLAMTFIAFIMLFVVIVLIQTMAIYNKGLALKQINQTGRQVGEDVTRQLRYSNLSSVKDLSATNQRLCVGGVTYAWNIGEDTATFKNKFISSNRTLRMVRIVDASQYYCSNPIADIPNNSMQVTDLVGSQVIVLSVGVNKGVADYKATPGLIDVSFVLSTTGNNQPKIIDGHWQCFDNLGRPNQFCAFGEFNNTTYVRGY